MVLSIKDEGPFPNKELLPGECRSIEKELAVEFVSAGWRRGASPWAVQLEAGSTLFASV